MDKSEMRKKVLDFLTEIYFIEEDSCLERNSYIHSYRFCMKEVQHSIAANQMHMVILFSQLLGIEVNYKGFNEIEVKNWGILADD